MAFLNYSFLSLRCKNLISKLIAVAACVAALYGVVWYVYIIVEPKLPNKIPKEAVSHAM